MKFRPDLRIDITRLLSENTRLQAFSVYLQDLL